MSARKRITTSSAASNSSASVGEQQLASSNQINSSSKMLTDFSIETLLKDQQQQMKKFRPKNFQCLACEMAFSNNGQLKSHVRIHTGERPFRCNYAGCNKTFTRNEELTRHKLIHTGIRPHSCTTCGKRFGRKDHLKKHSRTHEREELRRKVFVPSHLGATQAPAASLNGAFDLRPNEASSFPEDPAKPMQQINSHHQGGELDLSQSAQLREQLDLIYRLSRLIA